MKKTLILTYEEIHQKTIRIAHQLLEENYDEKELVLIGIQPNGYRFAMQLKKEIETIDNLKTTLLELTMNKQKPLDNKIELKANAELLNGKTVILVDDVANTGKTMYYALKPIMDYSPRKVQAAVLVDRQHKLFPVTPDFVGLSLSTTLQEHIEVEYDNKGKASAYLV